MLPTGQIFVLRVSAVLLLLVGNLAAAEFYSSIHEMTKVFGYEQRLLLHMQKFIADNESKLDFLKARLIEFERERDEAASEGVAYFQSPLNKFVLTKRLTLDWQRVENLMSTETGSMALGRLHKLRRNKRMPSSGEVAGAIDGLLRLQYIYRLPTKDIAAGILDGVPYGTELDAQLCLDIGRQALQDRKTLLAHSWALEARQRLNEESLELQPQILALLVETKVELEDFQGANSTYHELIELQPASEQHAKNYETFMQANKDKLSQSKNITDEHDPVPEDFTGLPDDILYRYTCSGHIRPPPAEFRDLRCGFMSETHPFLILAPLKVEELQREPLLVVYHDVIYQGEIDIIKNLTKNRFERAQVMGDNTSVVSTVRTSQFQFMPKTTHKVLQTIDERVADMTNLNMDYAEDHQFSNYGVGGHYAQHFDYFLPPAFETNQVSPVEWGNRIATVLFYLSDVAQGGGTAFPRLKQLLMPKKGSAAFWYNLHASGAPNEQTLHGACPIIVGSKWVQNRWIREYIQGDKRPCEVWDDSLASYSQIKNLKHKLQ
ncbi:prolyl 4-hydroxylase subunit alpha-1 [Scaptodrosophila lebanonensis]|uniref:procollagen-proline 4-dioxygenase n=1 Tax=Drosophila lebanonensis TaxID=7225 RepID=A0A6J2SXI3_DROLE|nr:prolyl 4-hydroxylase subunit alpha-1 [Scaptodrosophila lebanonensis]